MKNKYLKKSKEIIKFYLEGSDLSEEESHVLNDCANEHCQILSNVAHTNWFKKALAENLEALGD